MRYITVWRKEQSLDWDFYISESESEAGEVMRNLSDRKVTQASTYELGDLKRDLCIGHHNI